MLDSRYLACAVTALAAAFVLRHLTKAQSPRFRSVPPAGERVLILGASSGLGRTLAKQYAARGARVCAVARRSEPLAELARECGDLCTPFAADFADATDMERLRGQLQRRWNGLDTLHVCAGVSAVQPVMALTGIKSGDEDPSAAGVQHAAEIAGRAAQGNFFGPLVAAITFIPMMQRTSASPAILLVSSVAAVVPAPTRALYAATKAASLLLFQSLAIEHPGIAFTCVLPATIEGNFRASAVDADPGQKIDETNKKGLTPGYVASRCTEAVDRGLRGNVVMPWFPYTIAHHLYYLWPSFIEKQARKKYNFTA
ncbi:putative short-chain dehydrogenase reductase sdr [Rosellinia necatrix]|uniref:Putative short-chain dehydrogenase reductase sdr n=1 Tax=Rosellinia necatrix TaxID=77044 RepID=A0A1W2TTE7_ROSNE|nr:putative short-chain dehydrogenase reductase sdr [Rosellinia necatrix]